MTHPMPTPPKPPPPVPDPGIAMRMAKEAIARAQQRARQFVGPPKPRPP